MQSFQESDLIFTFPDDWTVRKFDDTAAYQSLSGHGLKGVDFICISPEPKLWLIEVKNYRPRHKLGREYRATRRPPEELAEHIVKKFQDSLRLINIVNASLHRSWLSRVRMWYRRSLRSSPVSNHWFWPFVQNLASSGSALEYVLWLETPEDNSDYDVKTYEELKARMPAGSPLIVAENDASQGLPFGAKAI